MNQTITNVFVEQPGYTGSVNFYLEYVYFLLKLFKIMIL